MRNDQSVFAAAGVGMYAVDRDGLVVSCNPMASQLLGLAADELIGRPGHETLHTGGVEACDVLAVLRTGLITESELDLFRHRDGSLLPVWWVAAPVPGTDGPDGVVVVFGDAESRRRAALTEAAVRSVAEGVLADTQRAARDNRWLGEISQVLSSTLDEYEAVHRVARLVVPRLADVGIVDLLTADGRLERVAGVPADGVRARLEELLARPEVQHRQSDARTLALVRSGQTSHLGRAEILDPDGVFDSPSRVLLEALDVHDMLVVPMRTRQRVLGVMALIRVQGSGTYTPEEIELAEDIGRRAGLALDNARLYHREAAASVMLQRALRPVLPEVSSVRVAARYRPAASFAEVGGDWYDLLEPPGRPGVSLVVGDVEGHDLVAAAAMSAIRNLLRGFTVALPSGVAAVMTAVDDALAPLGVRGTATCILMTAQPDGPDAWTLTWSSAGHPPPVLMGADGTVTALEDRHGPILGARLGVDRTSSTLRVAAGSTVVLYTDGLIEHAHEDIDTGITRLRRALMELQGLAPDPDALGDALLERLEASASDDTVLLVCHLPSTSSLT